MSDETTGGLATALAKAQAAMSNVTKDSTNPAFKSKFASLAAVRDVVIPAFAAEGIAVIQMPGNTEDGRVSIKTVLLHESGQLDCGTVSTVATVRGGNDAQAVGSALTYLRRYALAAIAGVAQEDDDANASGPESRRQQQRPHQRRQEKPQVPPVIAKAKAALAGYFGREEDGIRDAGEFVQQTVDKPIGEALRNPEDCKVIVAAIEKMSQR